MKIKNFNLDDFFIENKYTKWYINIINKAIIRNIIRKPGDGYEKHHILPKSICKELLKEKENLAVLTSKEHFICHLLLTKMCVNKRHSFSMKKAFVIMVNTIKDMEYIPCSNSYKLAAKYNSETNSGNDSAASKFKKLTGNGYCKGYKNIYHPSTFEQLKIKGDELDKYLSLGYILGQYSIIGSNNGKSIKIICLNTLEIFDSILLASKKYEVNEASIRDCFTGRSKTCGRDKLTNKRLVWMYYSDYVEGFDYSSIIDERQAGRGFSKGKICINNGLVKKYIKKEELEFYLSNGYKLGQNIKCLYVEQVQSLVKE